MITIETNAKPVTLEGEETQVHFTAAFPYFWIRNDSGGTVLMSIFPNISEGKDGVIEVLAGSSAGTMHGYAATSNDLYLLGSGKVQIMGTYTPENPFKQARKGGGNSNGTVILNIPFTSDLSYTGDVDLNITVEGNDLTFTNDGVLLDETRLIIKPVDFLKNFSKFTFEFDVKFRQVNKSVRRIVLLGGAIGDSYYSPLLQLDSNKFKFTGVESANIYGSIATSNNYNDNDFHHISLTYYMDTNFVFLTVDGSDCAAARFNNIGRGYIVLGHTYEPLYGYIKNFIIKAEG